MALESPSGCKLTQLVSDHIFGTVHGNELVPTINDVQRFPVQLFEAGLNLALFFVLAHLLKKNKFKGGLFAIYLVIYSIIRFFDEFLRGDSYRGFLFGLSTSQIISILIFIGAVIFLVVRNKKKINNKQVYKTEKYKYSFFNREQSNCSLNFYINYKLIRNA